MDILRDLVLPPTSLALLIIAGLLFRRRWPRQATLLIWAAAGLLYVLSTAFVGSWLLRTLEDAPDYLAGLPVAAEAPAAIVVLSGDFSPLAPEFGGHTVGPFTLERLRYAARLQRQTGLPILVSGGPKWAVTAPVAELMKEVLEKELAATAAWTERRAHSTRENAARSAEILGPEGIERIYLVTQAWHMKRATRAFGNAGFTVTPAPTGFTSWPPTDIRGFLPSARGLQRSRRALLEWAGIMWMQN